MKYSKLVKLAQGTQAPQMHKQAASFGRDIAITAGAGAVSGLAGYAVARLLGVSKKKALGVATGTGVAGAGLGYAGSVYENQRAKKVRRQLELELARSRKAQPAQSPYTAEGLKTKHTGQQTPRGLAALVQSGYLQNRPGPAPDIRPGAENQKGLGRSGQGALMLEELDNYVPSYDPTPQPQGRGPSDNLAGFRSLGY